MQQPTRDDVNVTPNLELPYNIVNASAKCRSGVSIQSFDMLPQIPTMGCNHNPKTFPSLFFRCTTNDCDTTIALIYLKDRIVFTGASSPAQVRNLAHRVCYHFQRHGIPARVRDLVYTNLVISAEVPFQINVLGIQKQHPSKSDYNPGNFPAVKLRLYSAKKPVALIFSSGKIIITGAVSEEAACKFYEEIYKIVEQHRTTHNQLTTNDLRAQVRNSRHPLPAPVPTPLTSPVPMSDEQRDFILRSIADPLGWPNLCGTE